MTLDENPTFLFQVQSYIQQILEGVGHIHSMNILHLDIKVRFLVQTTIALLSAALFYMQPLISFLFILPSA